MKAERALQIAAILLAACSREARRAPATTEAVSGPALIPAAPASSGEPVLLTRVVEFPTGVATVASDGFVDHVVVTSATGQLEGESWCPGDTGTYDQFVGLFAALQHATRSEPAVAAGLMRFPLRVNQGRVRRLVDAAQFSRHYAQIFTSTVVEEIQRAESHAVFCRNGMAMLGRGVIWAHAENGVAAVDVVNG